MSKTNKKQNLSYKYASSLLEYLKREDKKNLINFSLFKTFQDISENKISEKSKKEDICSLETITNELRFVTYFILETTTLYELLCDPIYPAKKKAELIFSSLPGINPLLKAFIQILADKNHIHFLPEITMEYNKMLNDLKGFKYVTLVSSCIPKEDQLKKIKENFLKIFSVKDLVIQVFYDSSILGGLIVYENSRKFDLSLKETLSKIIQAL